jgi:sugar phosphate permease
MGNYLSTAKGGWHLIYTSYFSGMLTKNIVNFNLSAGAVNDGTLDSTSFANVLSAGSLAYTFGKAFGGSFADWFGGKNTMVLSHLIMGGAFIGMSTGGKPSPRRLTILWSLSRLVHASLWPATSIIHKELFFKHKRFRSFAALLSTSSRLGAFAGSTVGAFLLAKLGIWSRAIYVAGIYYVCIGLLIASKLNPENGYTSPTILKNDTRNKTINAVEGGGEDDEYVVEYCSNGWRNALSNPKLWLVFIGNSLTTPTFELVAILPQYLSDTVPTLTTSEVGLLGSLFPLMAVPAVLGGAWLEPYLNSTSRLLYYCLGEFMTYLSLRKLSNNKKNTLTPTNVGMLLMTTMIGFAPVMYITPSAFLAKFAGPHLGSFSGMMDMGGNLLMVSSVCILIFFGIYLNLTLFYLPSIITFVAQVLFYQIIPKLRNRGGWPAVLKVYSATIFVSMLSYTTFFILEAKNPTIGIPFEKRILKKLKEKKKN